jgi:hypothetical protein
VYLLLPLAVFIAALVVGFASQNGGRAITTLTVVFFGVSLYALLALWNLLAFMSSGRSGPAL